MLWRVDLCHKIKLKLFLKRGLFEREYVSSTAKKSFYYSVYNNLILYYALRKTHPFYTAIFEPAVF